MNETQTPTGLIHCTSPDHKGVQRPGNGFFFVASRPHPTFCQDCADDAERKAIGWTLSNSTN